MTNKNFEKAEIFKRLNEPQREAVYHTEGPILVLAGAGTGKTGVLTTRLIRLLIEKIALPGEILSVTFTNKAANEMKERISNQIGDLSSGLKWLGTFHSVGAQILRFHPNKVSLENDFIILDTDDQVRLLKQIIKDENIDDKRWPAKQLLNVIDKWKNKGLYPEDVSTKDDDYFANGKGHLLYKIYQERLKYFNAVDFGDLILESIRLFENNPDILESYQKRFKYILVDEYQDTNVSQYKLLKLLTGQYQNICCVGDDDQSIYSWRGAEISNILRFEKDFPNAKTIRLEENYRSTGHILTAASKLIENNDSRLGKTLWTNSGEGEKITVKSNWDGEEEARQITSELEKLSLNNFNLDETAILVRASFQMREFEDRFIAVGLPYKVIGGPRFYERKEIRDVNAYLRLATQPNDSLALERIINTPKRGIGETSVKKIRDRSKENNLPLIESIKELIEEKSFKGKTAESLNKLVNLVFLWNQLIVQFYGNKISIDENKLRNELKKKINSSSNLLNEYLLYEILFSPNTMEDFKKEHEKIKKSIEEIGFESSANIFSNSNTAKIGGKIGWVNENQLSENIINNISQLNLGEHSNPIKVVSGNLILMVKDKRESKSNLSLDDELEKAVLSETNKKFNQYSSIYFKKVELNTKIYEK